MPAYGAQESLISAIETAGRKAFDPAGDIASHAEGQRELGLLISRTGTLPLISVLNALIKPDRVPRWLRVPLMDVLALLPHRPDGVRATLEFVFSTHPSSAVRAAEAAAPQKQGANITMEAMKLASGLLSVPSNGVAPAKWYPGIAPQLFALLDGKEGPDLVKVAAYVIGFGVLGRKQLGGPGTPGWKAFAEPMLTAINPSLSPQKPAGETLVFSAGPDDVVDLQKETILVQPNDLALALNRLTSLLNSHPNPGLTGRLLSPLVLPLWALSTWPIADKSCQERFCLPAKNLLRIFLKISGSVTNFTSILKDMLYNGKQSIDGTGWQFKLGQESEIQVQRLRADQALMIADFEWESLESKSSAFADLLEDAASDEDISSVFLTLFQDSFGRTSTSAEIKIVIKDEETKDPMKKLIEAKVLQKMMSNIPDKLVADSKGMLELSRQVLSEFNAPLENVDTIAIALSLLNIVVTAPSFQKSNISSDVLQSIESSLFTISKANQPEVSRTAHNLSLLLKYSDEIDDPSERPSVPSERQVEDRKTYNIALQYITQADSPPPVRSEGLNLILGLIRANSPVLDIQGVLVLLSSLLNEDDDYINLRVMKIFTQVAEKHPKSATRELLEHYVDASEEVTVDTRLRFGEAILQVVQRLGQTFVGETATQVAERLLSVAGRRGHRVKTMAKQAREARLKERQLKAAEKQWGGDVPDLSEELELVQEEKTTEDERAREELLVKILAGWESRRGSEDVRMRASALSVFSVGLETNIAGVGAALIEAAIDLCTSILTMEREMEKAILRRAAIILILTFVRALAEAKELGRRLGFGLTDPSREEILRILRFVADTDNDELVQQHARDLVESLENWQMIALLPEVRDATPALARIAGLDLNMPNLSDEPVVRPRIQEIE